MTPVVPQGSFYSWNSRQISTWNQQWSDYAVDGNVSSCSVTAFHTNTWFTWDLTTARFVTAVRIVGKWNYNWSTTQ